ncbi:hypothetical protein HZ326_11753 [Fusarium oxysporum f. sp. albedinis]|nr:hypothetical protein HZ326_11753 [Fusarium oxysporum f. sp. albedinis]
MPEKGIEGTVDLEIRSQPGSKAQGDGQGVEDPEDVVDVGSGTGSWQLDLLNDIVYPRVWIYSSRDPNRWVSVCAVPSSGVSGHGRLTRVLISRKIHQTTLPAVFRKRTKRATPFKLPRRLTGVSRRALQTGAG